jgi:hypothetical protein
MRFSSIVIACVASRSIYGSIAVDQAMDISDGVNPQVTEVRDTLDLLQFLGDTIAHNPEASAGDILNMCPREAILPLIRIFFRGSEGIDSKMRQLGLSLGEFNKPPDFIKTALSSAHPVYLEAMRRSSACREDVDSIQYFVNAVAKAPAGGADSVFHQFAPESIARLRRLYDEGADAIEARIHSIGKTLRDYEKDPTFLKLGLASFEAVYFRFLYYQSQSDSNGDTLDQGTYRMMERYMENDALFGLDDTRKINSLDIRVKYLMSTLSPDEIKVVCRWFKLGFMKFAQQAIQYSTDYTSGDLSDYFRSTALACSHIEDQGRKDAEHSENRVESKRTHH